MNTGIKMSGRQFPGALGHVLERFGNRARKSKSEYDNQGNDTQTEYGRHIDKFIDLSVNKCFRLNSRL